MNLVGVDNDSIYWYLKRS